jgi:hypothetical protein
MKTLNIVLLLIVSSCSFSLSPKATVLTPQEFDKIEIDGVPIIDIKQTFGNQKKLKALLGDYLSSKIDPVGDFYEYQFEGLEIGFSSIISDATHEKPILSGMEISSGRISLSIKGCRIEVGKSIDQITFPYNFNTNIDRTQSILIMPCDGCNNFLSIDFDEKTKLITRITYIEMT